MVLNYRQLLEDYYFQFKSKLILMESRPIFVLIYEAYINGIETYIHTGIF